MKKFIFILLPLIFFTACDSTYELIQQKSNSIKMERNKDILVTTSNNGVSEIKEYKNSGMETTNAVRNKLRPYASSVTITSAHSFKQIDQSELEKYDYIISPEIYQWEDRATNMNFMPDKVILGLTVYDNTGNVINYIEFRGESTKVTFDVNDPIDLVNEGLDIHIRRLFDLY